MLFSYEYAYDHYKHRSLLVGPGRFSVIHGSRGGDVLRNHWIPADQLAELCDGGGGSAAMRTLWAGQESRRRLLFDTMRRSLADSQDMGPLPPAALAWSAWALAERKAPVQCADLLLHPQVGSWAAYTLRRKRGRATATVPLWGDVGVLHTLALIACARAGLEWRTSVPVRDGRIMVPMLGMAVFDASGNGISVAEAWCADGRIRFRWDGRTVVVPADPAEETDDWLPLRRIRVDGSHQLSVLLDDLDPFRELADPVAADRLDTAAFERWTQLLTAAWGILCREHAETAQALAEGVLSIVPLPSDGLGATRSASTGEAFASVMISPPVDEVDLAVSLVHEFQHVKLGGLLHLLPLTGPEDSALYHAPWRDDPRPLSGMVQGVYAFFGIADFWRVRRHAAVGLHRRIADFEFAYARDQVSEALTEMQASKGLTEVGRRLVAGLTGRVRSWSPEPVEPMAAAVAQVLCESHRAEWRLRYVRPASDQVAALAALHSRQAGAPGRLRTTVLPSSGTARWSLSWQAFTRAHLVGRSSQLQEAPADAALLAGDVERALAGYQRIIAADPHDLHAWAGLSLATNEEPLRSRPEWVHAVFHALRNSGVRIDPISMSRELGSAVAALARPVGP